MVDKDLDTLVNERADGTRTEEYHLLILVSHHLCPVEDGTALLVRHKSEHEVASGLERQYLELVSVLYIHYLITDVIRRLHKVG